ncbi:hypothetical protein JZ751_023805, partial [Albula glossodonta]
HKQRSQEGRERRREVAPRSSVIREDTAVHSSCRQQRGSAAPRREPACSHTYAALGAQTHAHAHAPTSGKEPISVEQDVENLPILLLNFILFSPPSPPCWFLSLITLTIFFFVLPIVSVAEGAMPGESAHRAVPSPALPEMGQENTGIPGPDSQAQQSKTEMKKNYQCTARMKCTMTMDFA